MKANNLVTFNGIKDKEFIRDQVCSINLPATIIKNAKLISCDFDITKYHSGLFSIYGIYMPLSIQKSVIKRQAEFLAGRYVAKRALALLGINNREIGIGENRSPIWPTSVCASISHTNNSAICLAADSEYYQFLGCDIEPIISKKTRMEIIDSIINQTEKKLLLNTYLDPNVIFTVFFSAKESLFKALYPSVREYFDFSVAQIELIDIKNKKFEIRLIQTIHFTLTKGTIFYGHYVVSDDVVTTFIMQPSIVYQG